MANDWKVVSLAEHCTKIGSGATPRGGSSVYLEEGEITLIRSQNIYNDGFKRDGLVFITEEAAEKLKNVIVEENDILLNITGDSVARVCMIDNQVLPARVNQHVSIIRPKESSFNPLYLRYQLVSPQVQQLLLNYASAGATRNALTKSMIEGLSIPKPDLDTQDNIAHVLGTLDDKIELNSQMNETLEAMAQALFKSWFVDFDPVIDNALAAGNSIPDELFEQAEQRKTIKQNNSEKNQAIRSLFPDEFEFTEDMGWIPKGWESGTIADISFVKGGYAFKSKDFTDTGFPVIKIKNINSDRTVNTSDVQFIPNQIAKKAENFWLKTGDLMMAMTGATVGKFGLLVAENKNIYLLNQRVAKFSPVGSVGDKVWFIYCFLNQKSTIDYIVNIAEGSAQPNISADSIMATQLVKPSDELINIFNDAVDSNLSKMLINREECLTLEKLRDTLLPKLMSGEIRIPEAAALVEEA
ncbi:hypothetical protein B9T29_04925 [Acinetobacter sp. ANC 3903]|uniref:restriction endonuclease subunit S n=1 Tax=Acinetobacter sp. ANC 3903 TaxID=1977883 RepID=UPI000B5784DD|nr:restriction endonuclease subunit S [Acinetobacter sp. ANC 3903]OTG63032.1 hypothetical protein B9T29_04925 [Acinetobacter sp. ANC 3903]